MHNARQFFGGRRAENTSLARVKQKTPRYHTHETPKSSPAPARRWPQYRLITNPPQVDAAGVAERLAPARGALGAPCALEAGWACADLDDGALVVIDANGAAAAAWADPEGPARRGR